MDSLGVLPVGRQYIIWVIVSCVKLYIKGVGINKDYGCADLQMISQINREPIWEKVPIGN